MQAARGREKNSEAGKDGSASSRRPRAVLATASPQAAEMLLTDVPPRPLLQPWAGYMEKVPSPVSLWSK